MFVLHVGRHKCGSTSIQKLLADNADSLREHGVLYPSIARPHAAHHLLARHLKCGNAEELNEIIELERRHPTERLVLSSEDIGSLPPSRISQLKDRIGACETLVVIYIRDLIGWLPSIYGESTKIGANVADFDEFYVGQLQSSYTCLSQYCQNWASEFGWHNLRVRSLDSRSLSGGKLIEDFLSVLGLSRADLGAPEEPPRNVSLGWKVLEVLRAQFARIRRQFGAFPVTWEAAARIRGLVVRILTNLGLSEQRTQYLSARQCEDADRSYRLELEKLNGNIVGPPLPFPHPPAIMDRPFLPTLDRIPLDERREVARRMEWALLGNGQRIWDRQFSEAGIGGEMRRCIIDALAVDEGNGVAAI